MSMTLPVSAIGEDDNIRLIAKSGLAREPAPLSILSGSAASCRSTRLPSASPAWTRRKNLSTAVVASGRRAESHSMKTLTGKTALVTGSTDGLSRLVAKTLAGAGARVLVHGRNAERGGGSSPRSRSPVVLRHLSKPTSGKSG
jgi:hypothetical protein